MPASSFLNHSILGALDGRGKPRKPCGANCDHFVTANPVMATAA